MNQDFFDDIKILVKCNECHKVQDVLHVEVVCQSCLSRYKNGSHDGCQHKE